MDRTKDAPPPAQRDICRNRKAAHDYEILRKLEAGVALVGAEVKALREGKGQLTDAHAEFRAGRLVLVGAHIQPYSRTGWVEHRPERPRFLLVHRQESRRLERELAAKGLTLVPLRLYFKGPWVKVELALAKGRRKGDKREALRKKEADREIRRSSRVR